MAQIAMPRQHVTHAPETAAVGSSLYQRRTTSSVGPVDLIPNPDFSFPQQKADDSGPSPGPPRPRPMSLQAYPTGRRGSAPGPRHGTVPALPAFTFNPAASCTTDSPPRSPVEPSMMPLRPTTHRRGGSELIGGNARSGAFSLVSPSPAGMGSLLPPPANLSVGPPGGRGHRHRRSGAMSIDMKDITWANHSRQPQAESAPVTPLQGIQLAQEHTVNKCPPQPSLTTNEPTEERAPSPSRTSKPRVGFSEDIEYIRPLSTISSGTENSVSTVRGHSAANSLSSVGAGVPSPSRLSPVPMASSVEPDGRPSTAGAILDGFTRKGTQVSGEMFGRKRPMSAISPASPTSMPSHNSSRETSKRRSFFRLESRRSDSSVPRLQTSVSDPALSSVGLHEPEPASSKDDSNVGNCSEKSKSTLRKSGGKPRKVKSWANSIMARKGKQGTKSKKRAPTPPPSSDAELNDTSESEDWDIEPNFDDDNTVTIVSGPASASSDKIDCDIASWKPRLTRVDSDTMSPVIDLDAALGPFNTPQSSNPRAAQRGFGAHRRALHSAGRSAHHHRRTESAPVLPPFELKASGMGQPSSIFDVFEEEEPEDDAAPKSSISPVKPNHDVAQVAEQPQAQAAEASPSHPASVMTWDFNDGLGINHDHDSRPRPEMPVSPMQVPLSIPDDPIARCSLDVSPIEVVQDYEEPRTSSLTHSSGSTVTPQLESGESKERLSVMGLTLPLPQQTLMTPDTIASTFSSPGFRSSEGGSLDTPRLGTAASSMTDYQTLPSPHLGEPGPRVSTDVPSLSSSRSTMTSALQNVFALPGSRRASERSTSFCSIPGEMDQRRRKRSSIVSFSRFMHSSGERSKLSIEQRPQSEHTEPCRELKKKPNRLSSLMWWKRKDDSRA